MLGLAIKRGWGMGGGVRGRHCYRGMCGLDRSVHSFSGLWWCIFLEDYTEDNWRNFTDTMHLIVFPLSK